MVTTQEPTTEPPVAEPENDEDRSTRRLLVGLLILLGVAAVALLALLLWLLRPDAAGPGAEGPGGYPIEVVTTIYGYGETAGEQMRTPLGVEMDPDGNVWISNSGRSRVEVYTSDGGFIRQLGDEKGPGQLFAPYGLAVDANAGRVYVADYGARAVQVFTTEGEYVGHFPDDRQDLGAFGADGFSPYDVEIVEGRVAVASNDGIYFFDGDGMVVARWGGLDRKGEPIRGAEWGQLNFPDAMTLDPETGRLFVADAMNRRVVAIDRDGTWAWAAGTPDEAGQLTGFWQLPRGIEVGPDGNVYVIDTFRTDVDGMGTGHFVVLSKDGDLLSEFGRMGADDGSFSFPEQLTSGPDGLWAIADRENDRVVVFRLITPYPEVDDILGEKYPDGFQTPDAEPTPAAEPIAE